MVLLRKNNKPESEPSSYRPLYLLNDIGKIFEFLLVTRLSAHITSRGGLATNQFSFCKGRSTDDAVRELQEKVVGSMNVGFGVAAALDIKNAFNSIEWKHILRALKLLEVPGYLMRTCRS